MQFELFMQLTKNQSRISEMLGEPVHIADERKSLFGPEVGSLKEVRRNLHVGISREFGRRQHLFMYEFHRIRKV
jgi:hypothetical protein